MPARKPTITRVIRDLTGTTADDWMSDTPSESIADQLEAERARTRLLQGQIHEMLARIRELESKHNEPTSHWYPIQ